MADENEEKRPKFVSSYLKTLFQYFSSIFVLIVNLLAVSIVLNCNKDRNIIVKILFGIFAFMFSFLYLIIHFVRIVVFGKERCTFGNIGFFN